MVRDFVAVTLVDRAPSVLVVHPSLPVKSVTGMFAPAKTPAVIITQLNHEIARVLNQADVKERFRNSGAEAVGGPPEELAAKI